MLRRYRLLFLLCFVSIVLFGALDIGCMPTTPEENVPVDAGTETTPESTSEESSIERTETSTETTVSPEESVSEEPMTEMTVNPDEDAVNEMRTESRSEEPNTEKTEPSSEEPMTEMPVNPDEDSPEDTGNEIRTEPSSEEPMTEMPVNPEEDHPEDAGSEPIPESTSCMMGQVRCAGSCVNTQTDSAHCGACGMACPAGVLCRTGGCIDVQMGASFGHTCALLSDDTVKCWGRNDSGQLGIGNTTQQNSPPPTAINLGMGRTAKQIVAGGTLTCALLDNDTMKCWGRNDSGQLGIGNTTQQNSPPPTAINLGMGRIAKQMDVGWNHTCVLLDNDTVKCWGSTSFGQLGTGSITNQNSPRMTPINLGIGRTAKQISVGSYHTCALLDDDTMKCWGRNDKGQLGVIFLAPLSRPPARPINLGTGRTAKQIAAGGDHTCALLDDDTVKCWGKNIFGQLGIGNTTQQNSPPATPISF